MTSSLEGLITDGMVENGARELCRCEFMNFDGLSESRKAGYRHDTRKILLSVLPDIRKAVLEEAAKACEQYVHHQHPTKPGVIISSSPPSLAHANAIRALAKEGT